MYIVSGDGHVDDFPLGERELDVMGVLWDLGSGTVAEVREKLPADLAYTTVLTILRNLEAKGFVARAPEGKAHRYFPRVAQKAARRRALSRMLDKLFHGSCQLVNVRLQWWRPETLCDYDAETPTPW